MGEKSGHSVINRTDTLDQNERRRANPMFVSDRGKREERWSLNAEQKCIIHTDVEKLRSLFSDLKQNT